MKSPYQIFADEEEYYKDYKGKCAFCKEEFKNPDELNRHKCRK